MGILGGYLAALLGPTYFVRRRIGTKRWRQLHRLMVVVYVLAVLHSLGSGTDGASLSGSGRWSCSAPSPILTLLVLRYRPFGKRASARPSPPLPQATSTPG